MSSHHFVKDGQEPALFIVDPLSLALVEPLLEWAPYVLVLDTALDTVLSWGIKIDAVLAKTEEMESISQKIIAQAPVKILSYQDADVPLLKGLGYLITHQKSVHVITHITKHIFHLIEEIKNINITLLDQEIKWFAVDSLRYEKWLPANSELIVHLNKQDQKLSLNGLVRLNENTCKSLADGSVIIKSDIPFWIGETIN